MVMVIVTGMGMGIDIDIDIDMNISYIAYYLCYFEIISVSHIGSNIDSKPKSTKNILENYLLSFSKNDVPISHCFKPKFSNIVSPISAKLFLSPRSMGPSIRGL